MHNPPHPGELLKSIFTENMTLKPADVCFLLDVDWNYFKGVLLGKKRITADFALRLSKAFNTTPESWLVMQMNYDLWQAKQVKRTPVANLNKFRKQESPWPE